MQIGNMSGTVIMKTTQMKERTQNEIKGEILLIQLYLCTVLKEVKQAEVIIRVVTEEGIAWKF